MNLTDAPAWVVPLLDTVAVIEAVWRAAKTEPAIDKAVESGDVAMTVRFAVPEVAYEPFAAVAFTASVPGGVPAGTVLVIVTEAVWPGLSASEVAENVVGQLEGWPELMLNAACEHPAVSLFDTEIV